MRLLVLILTTLLVASPTLAESPELPETMTDEAKTGFGHLLMMYEDGQGVDAGFGTKGGAVQTYIQTDIHRDEEWAQELLEQEKVDKQSQQTRRPLVPSPLERVEHDMNVRQGAVDRYGESIDELRDEQKNTLEAALLGGKSPADRGEFLGDATQLNVQIDNLRDLRKDVKDEIAELEEQLQELLEVSQPYEQQIEKKNDKVSEFQDLIDRALDHNQQLFDEHPGLEDLIGTDDPRLDELIDVSPLQEGRDRRLDEIRELRNQRDAAQVEYLEEKSNPSSPEDSEVAELPPSPEAAEVPEVLDEATPSGPTKDDLENTVSELEGDLENQKDEIKWIKEEIDQASSEGDASRVEQLVQDLADAQQIGSNIVDRHDQAQQMIEDGDYAEAESVPGNEENAEGLTPEEQLHQDLGGEFLAEFFGWGDESEGEKGEDTGGDGGQQANTDMNFSPDWDAYDAEVGLDWEELEAPLPEVDAETLEEVADGSVEGLFTTPQSQNVNTEFNQAYYALQQSASAGDKQELQAEQLLQQGYNAAQSTHQQSMVDISSAESAGGSTFINALNDGIQTITAVSSGPREGEPSSGESSTVSDAPPPQQVAQAPPSKPSSGTKKGDKKGDKKNDKDDDRSSGGDKPPVKTAKKSQCKKCKKMVWPSQLIYCKKCKMWHCRGD